MIGSLSIDGLTGKVNIQRQRLPKSSSPASLETEEKARNLMGGIVVVLGSVGPAKGTLTWAGTIQKTGPVASWERGWLLDRIGNCQGRVDRITIPFWPAIYCSLLPPCVNTPSSFVFLVLRRSSVVSLVAFVDFEKEKKNCQALDEYDNFSRTSLHFLG